MNSPTNTCTAKRILGIDPGSRITGYGIIDISGKNHQYVGSGAISTPSGATLAKRLMTITEYLFEIIDSYQPKEVAIEKVFVNKNPSATLMLGQARGACISAVVLRKLPVSEYTALQVKQAVVGHGKAHKTQVQHMVKYLLKLSGTPQPDAADALAVALTHFYHSLAQQSIKTNSNMHLKKGRFVEN